MSKSVVLIGLSILVYISFTFFQFKGNEFVASNLSAILFILLALVCFVTLHKKELFFCLFLLFTVFAEILSFSLYYISYEYYYFATTILSILAYTALLIKLIKSVDVLHLLKNFKLYILVLIALNLYINFGLQAVITPYLDLGFDYILETAYNAVILLLLSISFLNFLHRNTKKSLFFFLASLFIVFGNVLLVAYVYFENQNLLNFISVNLFVFAFYFLFQYFNSSLDNQQMDEELEVEM